LSRLATQAVETRTTNVPSPGRVVVLHVPARPPMDPLQSRPPLHRRTCEAWPAFAPRRDTGPDRGTAARPADFTPMRRDRHDPPTKTCEVTTLLMPGHVPTCAVTDDATSSTPKTRTDLPEPRSAWGGDLPSKRRDLHDESGWTAENAWDSPNCLLSCCVTIR